MQWSTPISVYSLKYSVTGTVNSIIGTWTEPDACILLLLMKLMRPTEGLEWNEKSFLNPIRVINLMAQILGNLCGHALFSMQYLCTVWINDDVRKICLPASSGVLRGLPIARAVSALSISGIAVSLTSPSCPRIATSFSPVYRQPVLATEHDRCVKPY